MLNEKFIIGRFLLLRNFYLIYRANVWRNTILQICRVLNKNPRQMRPIDRNDRNAQMALYLLVPSAVF